ncbi:MAG: hypothetical protein J7578_24530, partial [Chitinophagaceae bacterium]|nr:hypothetical protein [Chitinophagaceae bacterium]
MKCITIIKTLLFIMSTGLSSIESVVAQNQKGKMYFSNKPFGNGHEGSRSEFSSADFIYGRIETDQLPLKQAFNMATIKTQPLYLQATYRITRDDGKEKYMQGSIFLRMDDGAENKTSYNFDIMPVADQLSTT